jgi:PAS domain S-box-containing protein
MQEGLGVHEILLDANGRPADYRFLTINPAYSLLTGLGPEIVGRTASEVIPNLEPDSVRRFGMVALTGQPVTFEQLDVSSNRHLRVTAFCNAPREFTCIISDITGLKQAEEALRTTQKLESVGVLAGGIAHDFNNMLTGIVGNLSLLRLDLAVVLSKVVS